MLAAGCSVCLYVHPMRILPHLRARVWVFLKERRWQDVATAVSWCDGYDEGQGALASTPKLWSCSVYTYKHSFFLTHTHYFSTAWHVADDCSSQRKCTKETHTSLLIRLTTATYTHTHKHLISRMSAHHPVTHTHLRLQTAPKTRKKENVDGSVQHNNRAGNLLVVLRQVLRLVSKDFCEC